MEYLEKICLALMIGVPKKEKDKSYILEVNDEITIRVRDLEPGYYFFSNLTTCPEGKREDLFIYLMRANLLGQGVGGARIGLDAEEKFLTLSHELPYSPKYEVFKEKIEDFINYVKYWMDEIEKLKKQIEESIL